MGTVSPVSRADLSHYVAQLMFRATSAEHNDSTVLQEKQKASLREQIQKLRDAIDAASLPEARKVALHERLDALEKELERKRIRFVAVASVLFTILSVPGSL